MGDITVLDMHVHSTLGKGGYFRKHMNDETHNPYKMAGTSKPRDYVNRILELRQGGFEISGFVFTEHYLYRKIDFQKQFKERYNVSVFSGVEVGTNLGHMLIYGVQDNSFLKILKSDMDSILDPPNLDAQAVVDWAKTNDCVPVPAHPFSSKKRSEWKYYDCEKHALLIETINGIDVIEGKNGACRTRENKRAMKCAKTNSWNTLGGSDTHCLYSRDPYNFCRCITKFDTPEITSDDDLIAILNHGSYRARYMFEPRYEYRHNRRRIA